MNNPPVVLGIDFGGTKIAAAVCDLAGNRLAAAVVDSLGERGVRASFGHGVQTARDLLASAAAGARLAAVGVSTFGIPFDDRVELAPAIDGWGSLEIGRELRTAFPGAAIRMGTDAKAAAQAEVRWGSLAGYDPAIYLNLGTGLAAAIVTGGQVLAGRHGAAGEIGYSLRQPGDVGLADGLRITLEDMVSGQAMQRRAGLRGQRLTAAEVFATAGQNADLDDLITEFVDELAFHVVNLAIAVNPARIAVGGGITRSWDRIGPRLDEALRTAVPYPPELVLAHFPHEAPLLGAVALAVDAANDATPASDATPTEATPTEATPTEAAAAYPADFGMHPASSNGHYSTSSVNISSANNTHGTDNASSRPQGSLPAGDPQATAHNPTATNTASKG
jgi:glucokinase